MKVFVSFFAFLLATIVCHAQDSVWRVLKSDDTTAAEVLNNGAFSAGSVTVSSATGLVSTAAAISAGTNTTAAAGLRVRVNGTNYIIRLFAN
jgi:hypothetical protein